MLYGVTNGGGRQDAGVLFQLPATGGPIKTLVEFDGNGTSDVFVRDRKKKETTRVVCTHSTGSKCCCAATNQVRPSWTR